MAVIIGTDYRKRERDVLRIWLPGFPAGGRDGGSGAADPEDGFELDILPPTKGIYDEIKALADALDDAAESPGGVSDFDMDLALRTVASAMGRNEQKREISPAFLESIGFDIIDIGDFAAMYVIFLTKLVEEKN